MTKEREAPRVEPSSGKETRAALSIAKGSGFLAGGTFFEFGSRFIIGLLLARLLGPSDYGLYHLAISAGALFAGISSLGMDDAMIRFVAIFTARRDRAGVWGTIQVGLLVATPVAFLMGGALYLLAPLVAEGLFDSPELTPLLHLMAFVVPVLTLSNTLLGVVRGFGRMDYAAFGENVVQSLLRVILLGIMALVGLNVFAALVIFAISDLAAVITFALLIDKEFSLRPSAHPEARREVGEIFRFSFPLWLSGQLSQFRSNIAAFFLGSMASTASVGVFAIVANVNMVGHAVYRAVITAVKPLLAQLHDKSDRAGLIHIYTITTRWLVMSNVPFFLALVLYPASILAIFGEGFSQGATALMVMATAELFNAATGICGSLIDMTGHTGAKLFNSVLYVVLLIGGNFLLVPPLGVLGAAIAYFIAFTTVNLARVVEMWLFERVIPSWRAYLKPGVAGVAAFGFGWGLQQAFPVDAAFFPALGQGLLVVLVYLGGLVLMGFEPDDRAIYDRALARVRRRK